MIYFLLLSLLQLESLCGLIANLRWTPVLDRTWIYISCLLSPLLTLRSEELEWSTVELYESLADYWLVGTVTTLDILIIVIGTPPAIHSAAGAVVFLITDM